MRHGASLAVLLSAGILVGGAPGCDKAPEGTLEVHWSVNGELPPGACAAAGVVTVRVLFVHSGTPPDSDPANPTGPYRDFSCADGVGQLRLIEGIYRVRLVALDSQGTVRSKVVERQGVEVVGDRVRSIPTSPGVEPPLDLEVAICGDGVLQTGEWCDGDALGDHDCVSRGFDGGELSCKLDCTLDVSLCFRCGDGNIDPGESCDGSNLGGQSCESLGLAGGTLGCGEDCAWDLSSCVGCGNGVLEEGEECDDGNFIAGDGCSPDCRHEKGPLAILWTVRPSGDASAVSSCGAEGILSVLISVTLAGTGTVLDATELPCTQGQASFPDVGYGLYTVRLSGQSATQQEVARGISAVIDHSHPDGTWVLVDLIALP